MSETVTVTLSDFLLARLADLESRARRFHPDESLHVHFSGDDEPTVLYTAADVLAEVAAKRAIIEWHYDMPVEDGVYGFLHACGVCHPEQWPCDTLRALAQPYSDHPDFREEWRA